MSKKPLDPVAKMPEPFRPVSALSDIPPWILKGCEALLFPSLWNLAVIAPCCHRQLCQAGLLVNKLSCFPWASSCSLMDPGNQG